MSFGRRCIGNLSTNFVALGAQGDYGLDKDNTSGVLQTVSTDQFTDELEPGIFPGNQIHWWFRLRFSESEHVNYSTDSIRSRICGEAIAVSFGHRKGDFIGFP